MVSVSSCTWLRDSKQRQSDSDKTLWKSWSSRIIIRVYVPPRTRSYLLLKCQTHKYYCWLFFCFFLCCLIKRFRWCRVSSLIPIMHWQHKSMQQRNTEAQLFLITHTMLQEYLYTVKNKTINFVIAFICIEFFTTVCTVTACGQKYLRNFIQARHIQAEVQFWGPWLCSVFICFSCFFTNTA